MRHVIKANNGHINCDLFFSIHNPHFTVIRLFTISTIIYSYLSSDSTYKTVHLLVVEINMYRWDFISGRLPSIPLFSKGLFVTQQILSNEMCFPWLILECRIAFLQQSVWNTDDFLFGNVLYVEIGMLRVFVSFLDDDINPALLKF